MVTDKEKFIALMKEFDIPLTESGREATETFSIQVLGQSPKVSGYSGFTADFKFDATTGVFIIVDIFE